MLECIVIIVSTVRILHPVIHEMVRLTTGRTPVVGLFVARKRKGSDCEGGKKMLLIIEGLAMCFILLMICVVGIANGPVGCVYFYEPEVQERVVELGLTSKEKIKKDYALAGVFLFVPILVFIPAMVYFINGARGFMDIFVQITVILMIMGLFDRIFIDWFWVGKTKAWLIHGTEDLMPYIPKKTLIKKWVGTVVGYPMIAAVLAGILSLF